MLRTVLEEKNQGLMKTTDYDPEDVREKSRHLLQGKSTDRATLAAIARQAMIERGLEPDFPPAAQQELAAISRPAEATNGVRDLRDRLWASIDNDDSRDLDQLTVAEALEGGGSESSWRSRTWTHWCGKGRRSTAMRRGTRPPSIRPPRFSPCSRRSCPPI